MRLKQIPIAQTTSGSALREFEPHYISINASVSPKTHSTTKTPPSTTETPPNVVLHWAHDPSLRGCTCLGTGENICLIAVWTDTTVQNK